MRTLNAHAVVWQQPNSDLQGAYLPSLKEFTVATSDLVNSVTSPYYGEPNSYSVALSMRSLYILVQPGFPNCDPETNCAPPPPQLYAAPAPRQPRPKRAH